MIQKTIFRAALASICLLVSSNIYAEDEVNISTIKLTDQIHMLVGKGGNLGVFVGDDGTFVIDDQFAPLTEKLMAAITAVGGESPKFLINTHFHGDHTGGNENFGNQGALIVSHDLARERLVEGYAIDAFKMTVPPAPAAALPVVTYSEDMHFHINQEDVKLIHVGNAHTDGDSFVHFKQANVIHAGDIFFNGFYPFIDLAHGGSIAGTIAAAEVILALADADTKIIPGHGPLGDKAQLKAYKSMLETALAALSKLKDEGLSLEDAKARQPLESLDGQWSGGIFTSDRWIELMYPELQ